MRLLGLPTQTKHTMYRSNPTTVWASKNGDMVDERGRNVVVSPQPRVIDILQVAKVPLSPAFQNIIAASVPVFAANMPNRFRCGVIRLLGATATNLGGTTATDNYAIPDPSAEDEGHILQIVANTASVAHTIYFVSNIDALGNTFTFTARSATTCPQATLIAHNSKWTVISMLNCTQSQVS